MAFNDDYSPVSPEPFWRIGDSLPQTKWEYREETNCTITELGALSLEGWELAGVFVDTSKTYLVNRFFFKRPMATIYGEWH